MIADQLAPKFRDAAAVFEPVIRTLLEHFRGFERMDVEAGHLPENQIHNFLCELDLTYPNASPQKLKIAIRHFLCRMDCFRYRLVARNADNPNHNIAIWNALEEPLPVFLERHKGLEILCRPGIDAYPTADLIADWINVQVDILRT